MSGYKAAYLVRPEEYIKVNGEYHRVMMTDTRLMELPESVDLKQYVLAKSTDVMIWLKPFYPERFILVDRMHGFYTQEGNPLIKPAQDPIGIAQHLKVWFVKNNRTGNQLTGMRFDQWLDNAP